MKAVEITAFGGPDVLKIGERELPIAGRGDLCIRVRASGINRPDVLQRAGQYPAPAGASDIPGLEVAGTIESGNVDELRAAGFMLGDRVCALVAGGGYAEFCVAPIGQCLPVPAGLSDIDAASLPETFFTVWSNVFDRGRLIAGETLLIQGGTSGIGVTAIQLAKAKGATVLATAGTDEKCEAILQLGADLAINYRTQDFESEVMRYTDGRGADAILDMVAGSYVAREANCLAEDGRLVIIAVQGGVQADFNAATLMRRRLTVTGSTLRQRSVAFKQDIAYSLREHVWPLLESGVVRPVVHEVFPATYAAAAHRLIESHEHIGKIVLHWGAP